MKITLASILHTTGKFGHPCACPFTAVALQWTQCIACISRQPLVFKSQGVSDGSQQLLGWCRDVVVATLEPHQLEVGSAGLLLPCQHLDTSNQSGADVRC